MALCSLVKTMAFNEVEPSEPSDCDDLAKTAFASPILATKTVCPNTQTQTAVAPSCQPPAVLSRRRDSSVFLNPSSIALLAVLTSRW